MGTWSTRRELREEGHLLGEVLLEEDDADDRDDLDEFLK